MEELEEKDSEVSFIEKAPKKRGVSPEKKKLMLTTLLLMFPALLLTAMVCWQGVLGLSGLAIALFFFQTILLKNFIEDKMPKAEEVEEA